MPQVKFTTVRDFMENRNTRLQEVANTIKEMLTGSEALNALGGKIEHMLLNIGCPQSVCPMLNRMICKGPKHWSQGRPGCNRYGDPREPLGMGHFRWDWKVYILTDTEVKTVVKVFKYIRG